MKKVVFIVLPLLMLFLSGCASRGNESLRKETSASISEKITKGVTTSAQVQAALGSPDSNTFTDSGKEIWKYSLEKAKAKAINFIPVANWFSSGHNYEKKELTILFDQDNVVMNYTFAETKGETSVGIVPQ